MSQPSSADWIYELPRQNESEVAYNDEYYRLRLQSLQAVDELVESVVNRLDELNLLENTYVIFTTDNGYHIGQHRLPPGKTCAIEEDYNIPFYIRGPGAPKGKKVDFVTTHTDIAPTLFQLAGIPLRDDFDGSPIPVKEPYIRFTESQPPADHVNIEFWGTAGGGEGLYGADYPGGPPGEFILNHYNASKSPVQNSSIF